MKLTKKILKKSLLSVLVMLMTFSVFTNATQALSIGGGGTITVRPLEYNITINKIEADKNGTVINNRLKDPVTPGNPTITGVGKTYTYTTAEGFENPMVIGTQHYAYRGYYVVNKDGSPYVGSPTNLQKGTPAVTTVADGSDTVDGKGSYSIYVVYGKNDNSNDDKNLIADDEETYNITEKYVDKSGATISADTTKVINGIRYTGSPKEITSYTYKGYYITSTEGDTRGSLTNLISENPNDLILNSTDGKDDYVVTFVYEKSTIAIEVIYYANGGVGSMASTKTSTGVQTTLATNRFFKAGYKFDGWATSSNGSKAYGEGVTTTFDDSHLVDTNKVKLYALWIKDDTQWAKITFRGNGSDGGSMTVQEVLKNSTTALNNNGFTRTGYTFEGWATTAGGEKIYDNQGNIRTSTDIELFAVWKANQVTAKFNANADDAEGTMADQKIPVNTATNLNENKFTRPGYTFEGWATNPTGGVVYTDKEKVTFTESGTTVELYAVWSIDETKWVTIKYHANDLNGTAAVGTMVDQKVLIDTSINLNTNGFDRGVDYKFLGWSTTPDGAKLYDDKQSVTLTTAGTLDLYAVWATPALWYEVKTADFSQIEAIKFEVTLGNHNIPTSLIWADVTVIMYVPSEQLRDYIESLEVTRNGVIVTVEHYYNAATGQLIIYDLGDINPGDTIVFKWEQWLLDMNTDTLPDYYFDATGTVKK